MSKSLLQAAADQVGRDLPSPLIGRNESPISTSVKKRRQFAYEPVFKVENFEDSGYSWTDDDDSEEEAPKNEDDQPRFRYPKIVLQFEKMKFPRTKMMNLAAAKPWSTSGSRGLGRLSKPCHLP